MLPVLAVLLHLVATSSSEVCVAHVSIDTFNITAVECSRGCCGSDLLCGGSAIGSTIPDNISNTIIALPDVQRISSALWEFGTWSAEVLAEINRVVWHVVRETDPTVVTNHRLCLLAMCTHDWWALHPHRSKNHLSAADVMSLVGKGLGLVVVGQLLGLLVCVKMLPHVAVVAMAVDASIITSIANVPTVVMVCVGLYLLAFDLHFALPVCAALSLAYWCSALWVGWSLSLIVGGGLVAVAVAMRRSWLLFPRETLPPPHTRTHTHTKTNTNIHALAHIHTHTHTQTQTHPQRERERDTHTHNKTHFLFFILLHTFSALYTSGDIHTTAMMPTPTAGDDMSTLTVLTSDHSADDIVTAITEYLGYDKDVLRQLGEELTKLGIQRVGILRGLSDEEFSELLTTVCSTHLGVKSALRHVRGVFLPRCATLAQIWASFANYTMN
jgi:hypothetical protein